MRTVCHACRGDGVIVTAVAAARVTTKDGVTRFGPVGTVEQRQPCRTCDGEGWLKGFVPPV